MMNLVKKMNFLSLLLLATGMLMFTSCERSQLVNVESFTDSAIEKMQAGVVGKSFCLELIFPLSIQFADETTAEVTSYENLHETVLAYFEENEIEKNKENRPELVFPIQVVNEEGEIIDVASRDELRELKKECPKTGKCKGKKGKGFKCFSLVFPITITIDGTDTTFETQEELKAAVKAYKEEAGPDAERPTLVFPVTVEYDDESQVTVNSQEELKELKDACKEDN